MVQSRISAEAAQKIPGWEKPHAKTAACLMTWKVMRRNEWNCIVKANKKTEQLYKVSTPCVEDHGFKKEELETVGEPSKICSQIVSKCLFFWHELADLTFLWSVNKLARVVTKWTRACVTDV